MTNTSSSFVYVPAPKICDEGGSGLFLPIFSTEYALPAAVKAILYGLGLAWMFMGVAIIADIFMVAIEEITAKRKEVKVQGKSFYVKTWNDTVANLTLMALGSSAPEILLAVLETIGGGFFAGDLGPSTIVGSAAFNLMCIIAVCIIGLPSGEVRRINDLGVFAVTCTFSIFAYVWLVIVLMVWTPNVVTMGEAIITLLLFPAVVIAAFMADKGMFSLKKRKEGVGLGGTVSKVKQAAMAAGDFPPELVAKTLREVREEYGDRLTDEQANKLAIFRILGSRKKSRAEYRIESNRKLAGRKKTKKLKLEGIDDPDIVEKELAKAKSKGINVGKGSVVPLSQKLEEGTGGGKADPTTTDHIGAEGDANASIIQFSAAMHGFLESAGTVEVAVQRIGGADQTVIVRYETRDVTAVSGEDYEAVAGELTFNPGEMVKDISVRLIDDNQWEPDETFDIVLMLPVQQPENCKAARLGDPAISTITIINDDSPGMLCFTQEEYEVNEKEQKVVLTVTRKNGSDGTVTCRYQTQDHADRSATPHADYEPVSGTLVFDHAEIKKTISVPIVNDETYEKDERFQVRIYEATGGAVFNSETDGNDQHEIAVVKIVNDQELRGVIDKLSHALNLNMDRLKLGSNNWKQQFIDACNPLADDDDDDDDDVDDNGASGDAEPAKPSPSDWFFHIVTLPFKLFYATCPPVEFCGGWLCFVWSLAYVGLTTALIGDLASLFGCSVGLPDSVTAITFVALGTSLPDTFASMAAAKGDPYADAAVGNVTGSNAVNVFLGLGLPWTAAAIYWSSLGKVDLSTEIGKKWVGRYSNFDWFNDVRTSLGDGYGYIAPAGDLGPSVITFVALALSTVAVLLLRRRFAGGELGGPKRLANISAGLLVSFWLTYVAVSTAIAMQNLNK